MTCQECIPEFGEECINAATHIKGLESNNFTKIAYGFLPKSVEIPQQILWRANASRKLSLSSVIDSKLSD